MSLDESFTDYLYIGFIILIVTVITFSVSSVLPEDSLTYFAIGIVAFLGLLVYSILNKGGSTIR